MTEGKGEPTRKDIFGFPLHHVDSISRVQNLTIGVYLSIGFFVSLGVTIGFAGLPIWKALLVSIAITAAGGVAVAALIQSVSKTFLSVYGLGREADVPRLDYEDLRDRANAAERNQRYEKAAELYHELIIHPSNPAPAMGCLRLGLIYRDQLANPNDAVFWLRRGMAIIREEMEGGEDEPPGDPTTHALWPELERALKIATGEANDADGADAHLDNVRAQIDEGQLEEARAALADLRRRFPRETEVWFHSGIVETNLQRYQVAVDYYKEAIRLDAMHYRAMFNLAASYLRQDRNLEAIEVWERYLEVAKDAEEEAEFLEQARTLLDKLRSEVVARPRAER